MIVELSVAGKGVSAATDWDGVSTTDVGILTSSLVVVVTAASADVVTGDG